MNNSNKIIRLISQMAAPVKEVTVASKEIQLLDMFL